MGKIIINKSHRSQQEQKIQYPNTKNTYYDLTTRIVESTIVFPNDPSFKSDEICSLASGSQFHLCHLHLGNHTGTHIDFPAHVIKNGKTSSDYAIIDLIGNGTIIEVPESERSISKSFLDTCDFSKNDFVFFKTAN